MSVGFECLGSCWREPTKRWKSLISLVYFNTIVGKRGTKKSVWVFSLSLWTFFCSWQFTQSDIFSSERVWMVVWFPLMRWSCWKKLRAFPVFLSYLGRNCNISNKSSTGSERFICVLYPESPSVGRLTISHAKHKQSLLFWSCIDWFTLVSLCEQIVPIW